MSLLYPHPCGFCGAPAGQPCRNRVLPAGPRGRFLRQTVECPGQDDESE